MSKLLSVTLVTIAFLLSSVTAVSVALAVYDLIEDSRLALLFAIAAVLLDIFKYLAWPVAVRMLTGLRAFLMMFCAVLLSAVSAWATYDRLASSISHSQATHAALVTERVKALKQLDLKNSALLESLDKLTEDAAIQANLLRAKGMVSKALELEESVAARVAQQRADAMSSISASSLELTRIKSSQTKAAGLPSALIPLLCLSFALSLEIVPALVLSSVRCSRVSGDEEAEKKREPLATTMKTVETAQYLIHTDSEILGNLVKTAKSVTPGTPIKLKEFAKSSRIGNLRAGQIFRQAEQLGHLRKTTIGYVAA